MTQIIKPSVRSDFYCEGRRTYINYGTESDCPYAEGDERRDEWFFGWFDAADAYGTL